MNRRKTDFACLAVLAAGVLLLPFLRHLLPLGEQEGTYLFYAGVLAVMLLTRLFGYSRGYTKKERREDSSNFIVLLVLVIALAAAALLSAAGGTIV